MNWLVIAVLAANFGAVDIFGTRDFYPLCSNDGLSIGWHDEQRIMMLSFAKGDKPAPGKDDIVVVSIFIDGAWVISLYRGHWLHINTGVGFGARASLDIALHEVMDVVVPEAEFDGEFYGQYIFEFHIKFIQFLYKMRLEDHIPQQIIGLGFRF